MPVFPLGDMERTTVQEGRAARVNTTLADLLHLADDLGILPEDLHVCGEVAASPLSRSMPASSRNEER